MIDRSPLGWCVRTVRSSCSTSSRRADLEKMRGTSRRSEEDWAGGTVSVIRLLPSAGPQSYARGESPPLSTKPCSDRDAGPFARRESPRIAGFHVLLVLTQQRVQRRRDEQRRVRRHDRADEDRQGDV